MTRDFIIQLVFCKIGRYVYLFSAAHIILLPCQKNFSSYSLLSFVYVTSQLRHSFVVPLPSLPPRPPLPRKILNPPLQRNMRLVTPFCLSRSTIIRSYSAGYPTNLTVHWYWIKKVFLWQGAALCVRMS